MVYPSVKSLLTAAVAASCLASSATAQNTSSSDTSKSFCNKYFCTELTYSASAGTLRYNITGANGVSPSWVAVGTGTRMAGSRMWMTWPTSNGGVALSERTASGHNAPTIASSPIATVDSTASTSSAGSSSYTSVWTVPQASAPGSSFPLIWAYKSGSVPSSASASITGQHDDYGTVRLDLTQSATSDGGSSSQPVEVGSGGLWYQDTKSRNLVVGHAVAMVVAWAVAAPFAILLGRFGRGYFGWVLPHWITQGAITTVGALVGLILIVIALQQSGSEHFENGHEIIGLIVLFALVLQLTGGWWIHHRYNPDRQRRPWTNWGHMAFGMALLIGAFVAIYTGVDQYTEADKNKWMKIVFYVWAVILALIFIGGWFLIPRQLRKEREVAAARQGNVSMNTLSKNPESQSYQSGVIDNNDYAFNSQHARQSSQGAINTFPFATGNPHASPHATSSPSDTYPYINTQSPSQGGRANGNRV